MKQEIQAGITNDHQQLLKWMDQDENICTHWSIFVTQKGENLIPCTS